MQNHREVKNNPHSLVLQELMNSSHELLFSSASASRGFCLIKYSILIGCFNMLFRSVKYPVFQQKF